MSKVIELLKELNIWSVAFRVFLSLVLGGCIGFERAHHKRAAGLRTHILVCLGACVTALIGIYSTSVLNLGGDAMRIGAQVISGIGFLGAGTIMVKKKEQVTGLTTAAGLWATASIGLAIGVGFYAAAIFAFAAILLTMTLFIYLERPVKKNTTYICYVELANINGVNALYDEIKSLISTTEVIPPRSGVSSHVGLELRSDSKEKHEELLTLTRKSENVVIALPSQN